LPDEREIERVEPDLIGRGIGLRNEREERSRDEADEGKKESFHFYR